ncbi:unnamed protein product [Closterium sp. Yama58-4]|nr:unnamed protein product [Closterium sp. Yama58-4]
MVLAFTHSPLLARSDARTGSSSGSKAGEIHGARLRLTLGFENRRFGLAGDTSQSLTWTTNPRTTVTTAAVKATKKRRGTHDGDLKNAKHDGASDIVSSRDIVKTWRNPNYGDLEWEKNTKFEGFISSRSRCYSHDIVRLGLKALSWCADYEFYPPKYFIQMGFTLHNDSCEGSVLVTTVPWDLLDSWQQENGRGPLDQSRTVVGMLFLPREAVDAAKQLVEGVIEAEGDGMQVIGWREVPVDTDALGEYGELTMPSIHQLVLSTPNLPLDESLFEGKGYSHLRKAIHLAANGVPEPPVEVNPEAPWEPFKDVHVCSFSSNFVVYKAVCRNTALGEFYLDLKNELFRSRVVSYCRMFWSHITWDFQTSWC